MHPAVLTLVICAGAAALEGALAGRGVPARFAELRQPPFSPSLIWWFVIGGIYYIICFVILYRLLASDLVTSTQRAALVLLVALMVANAAWGFLFFRRRDLRASFLAFVPYGGLAVALAVVLACSDRVSALVLTPYLVYLTYAVWWSYRLWMLNRVPSPSGLTRA